MTGSEEEKKSSNRWEDVQIEVRPAGLDDIDALERICRASYPDSVRYQRPARMVRNWWRYVLSSPSSETYVWVVNGSVAGFDTIVVDEGLWKSEKKGREKGLLDAVLALLSCPHVVIRSIRRKIRVVRSVKKRKTEVHDIRIEPGKRIWAELCGVLPEYRGLGLGGRIISFNDERAKELGLEGVSSFVQPVDEFWCRKHESLGYVVTRITPIGYNYTKIVR